MNRLTKDEILLILKAIEKAHGVGYSNDPKVAALQAKLSIMLEVAMRLEGGAE